MRQRPRASLVPVVQRLIDAVNGRDLASLVACFSQDYANETPAHPNRGFQGRGQVRRNWTQIFAEVPDVQAQVVRQVTDGSTVWTEWRMTGTRRIDATVFAMAGVIIYEVNDGLIESAALYLEPVEQTSGDIDTAIHRAVGQQTNLKDRS
jgi:hypothetical protein